VKALAHQGSGALSSIITAVNWCVSNETDTVGVQFGRERDRKEDEWTDISA
jgi:hypothetical protein